MICFPSIKEIYVCFANSFTSILALHNNSFGVTTHDQIPLSMTCLLSTGRYLTRRRTPCSSGYSKFYYSRCNASQPTRVRGVPEAVQPRMESHVHYTRAYTHRFVSPYAAVSVLIQLVFRTSGARRHASPASVGVTSVLAGIGYHSHWSDADFRHLVRLNIGWLLSQVVMIHLFPRIIRCTHLDILATSPHMRQSQLKAGLS
jgi:hypothetical protein